MSTAIQDIYLTLYGQTVDGLTISIGATVNWHLAIQQPTDLAAFDLTGGNVVLALSALDGRSNPVAPPIVARQADIVSAIAGTALAQFVAADTYRTPALTPGLYGLEVWVTDTDGNRLASLPVGRVKLTGSAYAPGGDITPLPAQEPLAQATTGDFTFSGDTMDLATLGHTMQIGGTNATITAFKTGRSAKRGTSSNATFTLDNSVELFTAQPGCLTINMPPSPIDGQIVIIFNLNLSAATVNGNGHNVMLNPTTTINAATAGRFYYDTSFSAWLQW